MRLLFKVLLLMIKRKGLFLTGESKEYHHQLVLGNNLINAIAVPVDINNNSNLSNVVGI